MAKRLTPAAALDEAFVRVFIEELRSTVASPVSGGTRYDEAEVETVRVPGRPEALTVREVPEQLLRTEPDGDRTTTPESTGAPLCWQLRVVQRDVPDCVLPLGDAPITVGRRPGSTIMPACDRISRDHARIWLDESGPRIEDLRSRNGIRVNGEKVSAANLEVDDEIKIGSVRIYVEEARRNDAGAS